MKANCPEAIKNQLQPSEPPSLVGPGLDLRVENTAEQSSHSAVWSGLLLSGLVWSGLVWSGLVWQLNYISTDI